MKLRLKHLCVLERLGLLTILRAGQKCNNDKDFFCYFLEMYFRVDKGYYIYSACQYEHVPLTLLAICISSVFQSIQNGNMASPSLWKKIHDSMYAHTKARILSKVSSLKVTWRPNG